MLEFPSSIRVHRLGPFSLRGSTVSVIALFALLTGCAGGFPNDTPFAADERFLSSARAWADNENARAESESSISWRVLGNLTSVSPDLQALMTKIALEADDLMATRLDLLADFGRRPPFLPIYAGRSGDYIVYEDYTGANRVHGTGTVLSNVRTSEGPSVRFGKDPDSPSGRTIGGLPADSLRPTADLRLVPPDQEWECDLTTPAVKCWTIELHLATGADRCLWQIADENEMEAACDSFVVAGVPVGGISVAVRPTSNRSLNAVTHIKPDHRVVLVLGDSFISGEGLGWWLEARCHRSVLSWPYLVAARYAFDRPHQSVGVRSLACSGATLDNLIDVGQSWHEPFNRRPTYPPQIEAAAEALCHSDSRRREVFQDTALRCDPSDPALVLISVGGNDARFPALVKRASLGNVVTYNETGAALDEALLDSLTKLLRRDDEPSTFRNRYGRAVSRIRELWPLARIISTTYPDPLHRTRTELCGDLDVLRLLGRRGTGRTDDITAEEVDVAHSDFIVPLLGSDGLPDILAGVLDQAAAQSGIPHRVVRMTRFEGDGQLAATTEIHGICRRGSEVSGPWFSTLKESLRVLSAGPGGAEARNHRGTFHPNLFGQLYYVSKVFPEVGEL